MRDHIVDVVVELTPRLQYDGLLLGKIAVETHDLEDVLGPPGELLPVLTRCTKQRTDDWDGIWPCDIRDEFAMARARDVINELVDDDVDRVVHARCGPRCESL